MLKLTDDIQTETDENRAHKKNKGHNLCNGVLFNKYVRITIILIITGVICPMAIYNFYLTENRYSLLLDGYSYGTCLVPQLLKIPCGKGNVSESECHPGCCYDLKNQFCFHRKPSRFSYILKNYWSEDAEMTPRIATVPFSFQNSIPRLKMSIDEITSTHVSITFYDPQTVSLKGRRIEDKLYKYNIDTPEFKLDINGPQGLLLSTTDGPLIASDNIWEITLKLANEKLFGLGEIPLVKRTVKVIYSNKDDFSSVPLIFAKSNNSFHGMLIEAVTPTEVTIGKYISVRSIAKNVMKFHVFVGPTPKDILRDVSKFIGSPKEIDYWMLGPHYCREKISSFEQSLKDLESFVTESKKTRMPFGSHCGLSPFMINDICGDEDTNIFNQAVKLLESNKIKFVPQISPQVIFSLFPKSPDDKCHNISNILTEYAIKNSGSNSPFLGIMKSKQVFYPDYENLQTEVLKPLWLYGIKPDAVILENNWPLDESNITYSSKTLPYYNKAFEAAFNSTPQWYSKNNNGTLYFYNHNKYGNNFVSTTRNIYNQTTIWTSSQWMNGDVTINRQKVGTSWTDLQRELIQAALGSVSGHSLWSFPLCGDTDNFNILIHAELCIKWYMLSSYMPIIKIDSGSTRRDPLAFIGNDRKNILDAFNKRMQLLPYIFTALHQGPLLRPMFYQYPKTESLHTIVTQYHIGDALLIVPSLLPQQSHVHAMLPPGTWYEFWGGMKIKGGTGEHVTMTIIDGDLVTLIRGGSTIIMHKDPKPSAEKTRVESNFTLIIAMDCERENMESHKETTLSTNCSSIGSYYLSTNLTIDFKSNEKHLQVNAKKGSDFSMMCNVETTVLAHHISIINIYGLDNIRNNYDHYKQIRTSIDLCKLEINNTIRIAW